MQHDCLARPPETESVKPLEVFRPSRLPAGIGLAVTYQDGANFLALAGEVVRVDLAQRRHGAGAGALPGVVLAGGDLAQDLMGVAPDLLGGHPPLAADDEAAVGGPRPRGS